MIKLFWWEPTVGINFGDALSPIIVSLMSGQSVVQADKHEECKLLACGSIFQYACNGDYIWGTGIHPAFVYGNVNPIFINNNIDNIQIAAIRGPISRRFLTQAGFHCPDVYGDPAILMKYLLPNIEITRKYKVGIIPHISQNNFDSGPYFKIDVTDTPLDVINKIIECEKIISASLHGIIVAESFGIQAVWLNCGKGRLKYDDYYESTGRKNNPVFTLQEAIMAIPPPLPKLESMIENLLKSFPKEICKN